MGIGANRHAWDWVSELRKQACVGEACLYTGLVTTIRRHSPETGATEAIAQAIADLVRPGDVVRLIGELGAGKTTLVRGIAAAMGCDAGLVNSPTFVMINEYDGPRAKLVHVDAYRLHSAEDLEALGWDRYTGDPRVIMLIEWPDRIEAALPAADRCLTITIAHDSPSSRAITMSVPESWRDRAAYAAFVERDPVRCSITRTWVAPTAATYPFANDRARLADLNRWFTESYSLPRAMNADEDEESLG